MIKNYATAPLKEYSAVEIKSIRSRLCMTQTVFAHFMGVSKKTVEAWEAGYNTPNGPSLRLLSMVEKDPEIPKKYCIISVT